MFAVNNIRGKWKSIAILDILTWIWVVPLALYIRLVDAIIRWTYGRLIIFAVIAALLQLVIGHATGLYRGRYRFASFDEVRGILFTASITSLVTIIPPFVDNSLAPRSFGFICWGLAISFMVFYRFAFRIVRERNSRRAPGLATLIYGAGDAGAQLVLQMDLTSNSVYRAIGFIDDDPAKNRRKIAGLKVLGTLKDLPEIIQSYEIKNIVVAIANVNSKVLTELNDICRLMNVQLTRVPSTSELISGKIYLKDLESLSEEDLIGRTQIYPDEKAIANFLRGKRILISGAGGSIGSEIARQVHRYSPSTVFMLDRDESLLHSLQLSLDGKGMLTSNNLILADIRDAQRIDEVFSETKPDVVFHAAALKHLSILEMYPQEAEKTNVAGTENIARAAISSGVSCLVNISTDKATSPVSVLGKSKKKSEEIVKAYGLTSSENPRFLSVRFGNVLGSRGSVLEAFKYQISKGGPVVVTDPEVKRYFMTIPEAVHLVLEAGAKGKNGEVLVLDMGVQISIQDIAKKMITRSGKNIEIVFSGLRAGEKIAESLVDDETLRPITPGSKVLRLQN